ncbi:hypothetical protein PsYK624_025360 [Phanerochaete sordida]|uniref:Uncharacterized protein n=1 Tax=Phanerochaete sordida TaxID=48140 RepID=A0A9P3L8T3_9APHY|nr:hypothetical protein PsYK624_025360 [Phanerochaete sordida]
MSRKVYGYKRPYSWILERGEELGIRPDADPEDAFVEMLHTSARVLCRLAVDAGLPRTGICSIFVQRPDYFVWAIASTDSEDKLPARPTNIKMKEKFKEMMGASEDAGWWWAIY